MLEILTFCPIVLSPAYALIFLAYRRRRHIGVFTMIIDRLIRISSLPVWLYVYYLCSLEIHLVWYTYSAFNGPGFNFCLSFAQIFELPAPMINYEHNVATHNVQLATYDLQLADNVNGIVSTS